MTVPQYIPGQGAGPDAADTDPIADLGVHAQALFTAFRLRLSVWMDQVLSRAYDELFSAYLAAVWVVATLITTVIGGYYLVSGVADGLTMLTGSTWAGHTATGAIFLGLPIAIGYALGIYLRTRRNRRLMRKYQSIRDDRSQP